jgi:circadian clock protein KaiC
VAAFDQLLGGGVDRGTTTLLIGPAGAGKSAVATQISVAAASRGERVAVYMFDEGVATFCHRAAGLGMDVRGHIDRGLLTTTQVDPAELSPGEFAEQVRSAVVRDGASVVVIDSLNGYMHSMPEERFLVAQLHELFTFLRQRDVVVLAVMAQHGMLGSMQAPVDLSYLADNVLLFRFFETAGRVRQAISSLKRRAGAHERTIRELKFSPSGLSLSEPLAELHGILTGVPQLVGGAARDTDARGQ